MDRRHTVMKERENAGVEERSARRLIGDYIQVETFAAKDAQRSQCPDRFISVHEIVSEIEDSEQQVQHEYR
jgi:hypothetical protein